MPESPTPQQPPVHHQPVPHTNTHIALLGAIGSGKSTLLRLLAGCLPHTRSLDMSEVLGIAGVFDNQFGLTCREFQARGELVPVTETMSALMTFLESIKEGDRCVFGGVPRTAEQAAILTKKMWNFVDDHPLTTVRLVMNDRRELIARLVQRAMDAEKRGAQIRDDDKDPVAVERRFAIYDEQESGILDVLRNHGEIIDIIPGATPRDTFVNVLQRLNLVDECVLGVL